MDCPVCRIPMIVVEAEEIELDHCPQCAGVWFDHSELEQFLASLGHSVEELRLKTVPAALSKSRGEKPRRCPICRRRMAKISSDDADPVILDRCEFHGGYWFDGKELPEVIRKSVPEGELKKVIGLLENLFPFEG